MTRVDFFASVKKVNSTQRIDQRGAIGQRVQLVLEVDIESDAPDLVGDLSALQKAPFVRIAAEPQAVQPAEGPSDNDMRAVVDGLLA